jgi:hypothetical protein
VVDVSNRNAVHANDPVAETEPDAAIRAVPLDGADDDVVVLNAGIRGTGEIPHAEEFERDEQHGRREAGGAERPDHGCLPLAASGYAESFANAGAACQIFCRPSAGGFGGGRFSLDNLRGGVLIRSEARRYPIVSENIETPDEGRHVHQLDAARLGVGAGA